MPAVHLIIHLGVLQIVSSYTKEPNILEIYRAHNCVSCHFFVCADVLIWLFENFLCVLSE